MLAEAPSAIVRGTWIVLVGLQNVNHKASLESLRRLQGETAALIVEFWDHARGCNACGISLLLPPQVSNPTLALKHVG